MNTKKEKSDIPSPNTSSRTSDNKAVFGPLGKYAVIAVIMVSIIVTTAIVLDRELSTAEDKVAALENELAAANAADTASTTNTENTALPAEDIVIAKADEVEAPATAQPALSETKTASVTAESTVAETKRVANQEAISETAEIQSHDVTAVVATAEQNESLAKIAESIAEPATDSSSTTGPLTNAIQTEAVLAETVQTIATVETASTDAVAKKTVQNRQSQAAASRQNKQHARIATYKLEQKQHMTEMFARIQALESNHLDQYKARQDQQIERLREQNVRQQQMIEMLILRNKEGFDMRAASIQRHQAKREQMLHRI